MTDSATRFVTDREILANTRQVNRAALSMLRKLQRQREELHITLWDTYVELRRYSNQSHTAVLRSRAGKRGNWNRWKREAAIAERMAEVEKIARTESRRFAAHLDIRDLIQAGMVGLVDAANKYHPDRGDFAPFAYFRIRGAIIDANKRKAYREELNESIQAISGSHDGWLPPELDTCTALRPDAQAEKNQLHRRLSQAIALLAPEDAKLLRAWMEGAPIRDQVRISGMNANYTRDRITQLQARVRAMVMGAR